MRKIQTIEDIEVLVHQFYSKVQQDELLGPVFNEVIQDQWPVHLEKMVCFWQTILLEEHTYFGSPFPPHIKLSITDEHFSHWLQLFEATVNEHFTGDKADEAKWRANKMAEMFSFKLKSIKHEQKNQ